MSELLFWLFLTAFFVVFLAISWHRWALPEGQRKTISAVPMFHRPWWWWMIQVGYAMMLIGGIMWITGRIWGI